MGGLAGGLQTMPATDQLQPGAAVPLNPLMTHAGHEYFVFC